MGGRCLELLTRGRNMILEPLATRFRRRYLPRNMAVGTQRTRGIHQLRPVEPSSEHEPSLEQETSPEQEPISKRKRTLSEEDIGDVASRAPKIAKSDVNSDVTSLDRSKEGMPSKDTNEAAQDLTPRSLEARPANVAAGSAEFRSQAHTESIFTSVQHHLITIPCQLDSQGTLALDELRSIEPAMETVTPDKNDSIGESAMEKVTLEVAAESPEGDSPVHTECQESAMEEFSPDKDDLDEESVIEKA